MVFEKDWGKVTGEVYRNNVVPLIHQFKKGIDIPILMEDGASIYTAKATHALYYKLGILKMKWPANSLDLNPIENVWRLLKYRISRRCPETADEIRQYAVEEWDKLELLDFSIYVRNIKERCQAVINANGGHTKW